MDFNQWKKRYNNAVGGKYVLKYRAYQIVDGNYNLGDEITREEFEQHRRDTDRFYDMKNNVTIRPLVSKHNEGFFEYSAQIKDEKPYEVESACLEEFIKEYEIADRDSLENLLEIVNANTMVYKLNALSQLPDLLKKMQ